MISIAIDDKELEEHISSLPPDGREVFLLSDGKIRLSAVSATYMVNKMKANHRTGLLETYILGQAYIAGALLSSEVKGNDRIQLDIECGGPVKGVSVEAWASGAVRGFLRNNPIPLDKPLESLDTSPIFGPGFLTVTKILEGSKAPVSGQIMLEYGNIAKDLALYYTRSVETPSLFYISIRFDQKGRVWGAGGIFIQALPGCPESLLEELQDKAGNLGNMGLFLSEGNSAEEYIMKEFDVWKPELIGHTPVGFSCPCSREHFATHLKGLPGNEKKAILEGEFPLVLECLNCGSDYGFDKDEIERIFTEEK